MTKQFPRRRNRPFFRNSRYLRISRGWIVKTRGIDVRDQFQDRPDSGIHRGGNWGRGCIFISVPVLSLATQQFGIE